LYNKQAFAPVERRSPDMTELEHLKTHLIEAIQASNDADLLDLIFKLLLAEG
jgi:hypothetical protein